MKTVDRYNTISWYNKQDQLHREDGPAIEYAQGDKEWFPDSAPNKVAYDALKKQQTPFSRLPTATAPNKL